MRSGIAMVWFTSDLRLSDNALLSEALKKYELIIPVFCLDWDFLQQEHWGFKRLGARRLMFLLDGLNDLQRALAAHECHLQVVMGKPEEVITQLASEFRVNEVFAKKEVGTYELAVQRQVASLLAARSIEWTTLSTSTLFHPDDLPFTVRDIPEVFTDFRKRAERDSRIREEIVTPEHIPSPQLQPTVIPTMKSLGVDEPVIDSRAVLKFVGGEQAAMARARHYVLNSGCLSLYKETRNGLLGADYSSKLSPWLALGCISPRTIYWMVKEYETNREANDSTYWLVFELMWRDYFRFAMKEHKHKFFWKGGIQGKSIQTKQDRQALNRWINGETGVDFVDANMNELRLTGFMSNRGRQNVASYLINDLKLDWRWGAAYFEEQLIDYDVASNWGNWAYLAGVGNDPRGNRYFDIAKQARQYDGAGHFRRAWL